MALAIGDQMQGRREMATQPRFIGQSALRSTIVYNSTHFTTACHGCLAQPIFTVIGLAKTMTH